jgi:hypothetical protein
MLGSRPVKMCAGSLSSAVVISKASRDDIVAAYLTYICCKCVVWFSAAHIRALPLTHRSGLQRCDLLHGQKAVINLGGRGRACGRAWLKQAALDMVPHFISLPWLI